MPTSTHYSTPPINLDLNININMDIDALIHLAQLDVNIAHGS